MGMDDTELAISFRPMQASDLPLMNEWLHRPHVRRWWGSDGETYEQVLEHYLPAIEGSKATELYVVLLDEQAIGFIQTYLLSDYPEDAAVVGAEEDAAGIDLFIADLDLTGQGIGSEMLRRFVSEIVFAEPTTRSCIADPEIVNLASVRAFEKAGFRVVKEFLDPRDGKTHALVRLDRQ